MLRGGFALLPRPAESALLGGRGLPWIAGGLRGVTNAVARGLLAPAPAVAQLSQLPAGWLQEVAPGTLREDSGEGARREGHSAARRWGMMRGA